MKTMTTTLMLVLLTAAFAVAGPTSNAFTYQGRLEDNGLPVTGLVDLQFYLYDASGENGLIPGNQVAGGYQFNDVVVDQGVFSVLLDWAPANWNGDERWLEIHVRNPNDPGDTGAFTLLNPRQRITVVPYAIHALNGGGQWSAVGNNITNDNTGFVGVGRSTTVEGSEVFGLQTPGGSTGGMFINAEISGAATPYYGLKTATHSAKLALHEFEGWVGLEMGAHGAWLNDDGNFSVGGPFRNYPGITTGGFIESTLNGFKFPDGTVQTTAATGGSGGGFWSAVGSNIMNTNSGFVGVGRTTPVNVYEHFGLQSSGATWGGMYIKSDSWTGQPFYGYVTPNYQTFHYVDEALGLWRLYHGDSYLNFSPDGNLGVDMVPNTSKIAAAGVVESTFGGFKFPDGTIQTTAGGGGGGSSEQIDLVDNALNTTIELKASSNGPGTSVGPIVNLYNTTSDRTFHLSGGTTSGSELSMRNTGNLRTIRLTSEYTAGAGALFELNQGDGGGAIRMQAHGGFGENTNGPEIQFNDINSNRTMTLYGDYQGTGESRVVANVVEITGGSDLSEHFDVASGARAVDPGSVVCIDPESPGDLRLSTQAYDRKVAGIISGADGVKPGLLMGQKGTEADGEYPVALTGRVYCKVDAAYGPIQPGDLLTTSATPGHAMKVTDHGEAQGAILGKAMTALEDGQGMVLVLVSLQ